MQVISSGHTLVEGPRWHNGQLWFSDMHDHSVWRVTPGQPATKVAEIPDATSGLGFLPDGDLVVVGMHDRQVFRWNAKDGVRRWVDLSSIATWHANDLLVLPDGSCLVGNFGDDTVPPHPPYPADLAHIAVDGTVSVAASNFDFANGMVLLDGGRTLVVAETRATPPRLTAFTVDQGQLMDRRILVEFDDPQHLPDGLAVDDDTIWVASPFSNEVLAVTHDGTVRSARSFDSMPFAVACHDDTVFVCLSNHWEEETCLAQRSGTILAVAKDHWN